jgi:hypothetical protein
MSQSRRPGDVEQYGCQEESEAGGVPRISVIKPTLVQRTGHHHVKVLLRSTFLMEKANRDRRRDKTVRGEETSQFSDWLLKNFIIYDSSFVIRSPA